MKYQKIGEICVDSGTVWLGDPCYFDENALDNHHGDFTKVISERSDATVGFVVSTAFGDGNFPVEIKTDGGGRILELRVKFF